MGQFYASGHTTASTALKRLAGYTGKNRFYRANPELGRVFKTEYILRFMSDPLARQRTRRGLLKSKQLYALARQVAYGKQGRITGRDRLAQKNTSSCLTIKGFSVVTESMNEYVVSFQAAYCVFNQYPDLTQCLIVSFLFS